MITPESFSEFAERFYGFGDGIICSVNLQLRGARRICEVLVEVEDKVSPSGWSHVLFRIDNVARFRFEIERTTFEVHAGLQFGTIGELICLVFDAYPDDRQQLPDLRTNTAYVVGTNCSVEVTHTRPSK